VTTGKSKNIATAKAVQSRFLLQLTHFIPLPADPEEELDEKT
jgi:hypothetical protein